MSNTPKKLEELIAKYSGTPATSAAQPPTPPTAAPEAAQEGTPQETTPSATSEDANLPASLRAKMARNKKLAAQGKPYRLG